MAKPAEIEAIHRKMSIQATRQYAGPDGCNTIIVYHRGEMVGQISRQMTDDGHVTVDGEQYRVEDPGGHCFINVTELPDDLDTTGY